MKKKCYMNVSFKVAEQPSELKDHTSGLSASALVFYLNCSNVPCIYHYGSKFK